MLEQEHLEDVVNVSNKFKDYLNQTFDEDHATIAKMRKLRNDDYGRAETRRS